MNVLSNYSFDKFLLSISVFISLFALEIHVYNFYFIVSLFGVVLIAFLTIKDGWVNKIKGGYWILVLGFSLSCAFFSIIHLNAMAFAKGVLIFFSFYLCFLLNKKEVDFLSIFMWCALFTAVVSLLMQINGRFLFWEFKYDRNGSVFFDPNYASAIFASSAIIALINIKNLVARTVIIFIFALALFFTYSKGGMVAFFLGLIVFFYCRYSFKFIFYILPAVCLFAYIFIFSDLDLGMFRFQQGLNSRDVYFELTMNYVFIHQNLLGGTENVIVKMISDAGYHNESTHSYYWDLLLLNGIVPMIFLIPFILYVVWKGCILRSKYFPIFICLFALSNAISISIGGIGILSFVYTYSAISILNDMKVCVDVVNDE